jgi:hypothetical protein
MAFTTNPDAYYAQQIDLTELFRLSRLRADPVRPRLLSLHATRLPMSDLASLSSQLPDHLTQLSQLDELLQADPANAELLQLHADLKEVITMTIDLQRQAGQLPPEEQSSIAAAMAAAAAAAASSAASTAAASTTAAAPSSAASSMPSDYTAAAAASQSYAGASTAAASAAAASVPVNGVYPGGARVMAAYKSDGKYYVARIDRVDEGAEEYTVTYLEYNQQSSISFDSVRPWIHATPEQLKAQNTPVKALFPQDGLFYNASLDGPSGSVPGAYVVKFGHLSGGAKGKKIRVDVPIYDIILNERFINPASLQATAAASAKPAALTEDFPTPPHLVVNPTDSDAVKQAKIKKLKKLKFEHKKAYEEQESNKRKSSWQDFKAGKSSSGVPAAKRQKLSSGLVGMKQLQAPSMFRTGDAPDAVVGVVGSGRGVTPQAAVKKTVWQTAPQ